MNKILLISISVIILLAGCTPATPQPPTEEPGMDEPVSSDTPLPPQTPSPVDLSQPRGMVYLASSELLTMESYPLQFSLALKGSLPTPCHELHIEMKPPDAQNKIAVGVYSTADPNMICVQALAPFEKNFPLGSFSAGHYTLWVNGKQVAEFDA